MLVRSIRREQRKVVFEGCVKGGKEEKILLHDEEKTGRKKKKRNKFYSVNPTLFQT